MSTLCLCIVNVDWYRNSDRFLTIFTFGIHLYKDEQKVKDANNLIKMLSIIHIFKNMFSKFYVTELSK